MFFPDQQKLSSQEVDWLLVSCLGAGLDEVCVYFEEREVAGEDVCWLHRRSHTKVEATQRREKPFNKAI